MPLYWRPLGVGWLEQYLPLNDRLKVTNEQQDDGAGILHQVAQFPIDQVYFIYARHPLSYQDNVQTGGWDVYCTSQ